MKSLKLSTRMFQWVMGIMFTTMIFSCGKEDIQPIVENNAPAAIETTTIPQLAEDQLQTSQKVWNDKFGDQLTFVSYKYINNVKDQQHKEAIIAKITANESMIASGNINRKETVEIRKIGNDRNMSLTRENMLNHAEEILEVGNQVVEITWTDGRQTHTTQCLVNEKGIQWDNILTGVLAVDDAPEERDEESTAGARLPWKKSSAAWNVSWLWGSKRGQIGYYIKIYYNGNYVANTDRHDWGYINLGKARAESKIIKNSGSYGKIRYALGLTTPTGSLSFNYKYFTVSAGGLGSNIVKNGTRSKYP